MKRKNTLRILALEPYYGGSHKYFIDQWMKCSSHHFTLLTLPAYKWRWRMRHAAITFADMVQEKVTAGEEWDLIFCSDMLNLASCAGLLPPAVARLPKIIYFHENQLTYPVQEQSKLDYQSVFINFISALAADQVWFNSAFNRDSFLGELPRFLKKMPDYKSTEKIPDIQQKSSIHPLGVPAFPVRAGRKPGPVHILWAARWEFDKNPDDFFAALALLKKRGLDFRISVLGEQFRNYPAVFDQAKEQFADHVENWGFVSRDVYDKVLQEADIVVSTAIHEFFGLSVLEAASAGAYPVLPERLAYPEIFSQQDGGDKDFFYGHSAQDLAEKLIHLTGKLSKCNDLWSETAVHAQKIARNYHWDKVIINLDESLFEIIS